MYDHLVESLIIRMDKRYLAVSHTTSHKLKSAFGFSLVLRCIDILSLVEILE